MTNTEHIDGDPNEKTRDHAKEWIAKQRPEIQGLLTRILFPGPDYNPYLDGD
jgi:hypothetical protein